MKNVKFDCPLDFIDTAVLDENLNSKNLRRCESETDADILVVNPGTNCKLSSEYFSRFDLTRLSRVLTPSTGVNHIDIDFLTSSNITVNSLLDNRTGLNCITASSEFTWLHIMNAIRKFSIAIQKVDDWRSTENERILRSNELSGKRIGIIGLGRIGTNIANYARAFKLHVRYYDPYVDQPDHDVHRVNDIEQLCESDIIVISCYLTNETRKMITWDVFSKLNESSIIVNTARGEVVDEEYIHHLITDRGIRYSADVLMNEQDIKKLKSSKLYELAKTSDKVVITPHVAGATVESQYKALMSVLDLI